MVADVVAGLSKTIWEYDEVSANKVAVFNRFTDELIVVEPRTILVCTALLVAAALLPTTEVANTKILLSTELGVMLTDKPVSAKVELVDEAEVDKVPWTTCKMRNPPRKALSCAASRTLPATNVAGSVVGVAIFAVYPKTG